MVKCKSVSEMGLNCKLIDLCEDLLTLGVTEITMEEVGLNIVIIDYLRTKGVKVKTWRRERRLLKL